MMIDTKMDIKMKIETDRFKIYIPNRGTVRFLFTQILKIDKKRQQKKDKYIQIIFLYGRKISKPH